MDKKAQLDTEEKLLIGLITIIIVSVLLLIAWLLLKEYGCQWFSDTTLRPIVQLLCKE